MNPAESLSIALRYPLPETTAMGPGATVAVATGAGGVTRPTGVNSLYPPHPASRSIAATTRTLTPAMG